MLQKQGALDAEHAEHGAVLQRLQQSAAAGALAAASDTAPS